MALTDVELKLDTSEYATEGIVRVYVGMHGFPIRPEEVREAMGGLGAHRMTREHLIHAIAEKLVQAGVPADATLAQLRTAVNQSTVKV